MHRTLRPARAPRTLAFTGLALATGAALALSGCAGGGGGDGSSGDGKLKVVATTTQLTDFADRVGGGDIELTGLLSAGASAHHYDPTPADLVALGEADVLIVNGAGLETFVDSAVEASGFDGTIVTAADGIDLAEAKEITAEGAAETGDDHDHEDHDHAEAAEDHDHEAEDHDHAEEGHAEEGHDHDHDHEAEGDEHDHDHGDLNPHLWTSPRYASGMVGEIAEGLEQADEAHADDYRENAEAYQAELAELDEWVAAQFAQVPEAERVLVSGHDSLRYYLHDYGIAFAGSILPSFEDNAEPSAADIDALVQAIKDRGVKAVFVESSMSPALAETIAKEAGVEVADSESLYADSLGAADSEAGTYIGATIANTRTILEAWGVTPEAVPDSLLE